MSKQPKPAPKPGPPPPLPKPLGWFEKGQPPSRPISSPKPKGKPIKK